MELKIYDKQFLHTMVRPRSGEVRLGERVMVLPEGTTLTERLAKTAARYVVLGLPEDIGVRANQGRGGAYSAWQPVLHTLLNVQSNALFSGEELLILGHVEFSLEMERFKAADFSEEATLKAAREVVTEIDAYVSPIAEAVIAAGKELIVVGGGHNNAYPLLKGAAQAASGGKVSVINCDAHTDLRPLEGRHSGNGFSYAYEHGHLHKYAMVGLHEMYLTERAFNAIQQSDRLQASYYEDIFVRETLSFREAVKEAIRFVGDDLVGLELDIDCIQNIPSSAKTSSGISPIQARQYVTEVATHCEVSYFHLAEAAPVLSHIKTDLKTGKLLSYLITDYIKARTKRTSLAV